MMMMMTTMMIITILIFLEQVQDFFTYMSAGSPATLEHVWRERLLFVPEFRDQHGRRIIIVRSAQINPHNDFTKMDELVKLVVTFTGMLIIQKPYFSSDMETKNRAGQFFILGL